MTSNNFLDDNLLDKIQKAEAYERDLEAREAEARLRWRKFWRWLVVVIVCLAAFAIGVMIGLPIGRLLP